MVVLDSHVIRNQGIVKLGAVGNLTPYCNQCKIFSNIFMFGN